jgi:hypothetical protein
MALAGALAAPSPNSCGIKSLMEAKCGAGLSRKASKCINKL